MYQRQIQVIIQLFQNFKVEEKFTDDNIIRKYSEYIDKDIYDFIKNKKYNTIKPIKTEWRLDFSFFKQ